jgi:D-arginine dehydrogenase
MMQDFLIIGGGIAGISAAARLAPHGAVTVLEGESALAHHASGRSAAMYEPHYGLPPVVELSLASEAYFQAAPNVLSPRGMMVLATASARGIFDRDADRMELIRISPDEAKSMVPIINTDVVAHAAHASHAWDIDTDLLLQGFARVARSHGAQIVMGARVTAIARTAGGWRVTTASGDYSAKILINAAGAWVDQIAEMAAIKPLGFTPMRRSMARIPAPGGHDVSTWPMMFGAGEAWYAKPDRIACRRRCDGPT